DGGVGGLETQTHVEAGRWTVGRQGRALRTDREGDAEMLGGLGQAGVDGLGPLRPAGHGADQQGGLEPTAKEVGAEVDLAVVEVRQGLMHETDVRKAAVAPVTGLAGEDDVEMLVLAIGGPGQDAPPSTPWSQGCLSTVNA